MVSKVTVGDKTYPVACNAFTPIIYSGGLRYKKKNGKTRAKDINDGLSAIADTLEDFDIPPFLPLFEFFWAFAKTADKSVPDFKEFLESMPESVFDMSDDDNWAVPVMEAVRENFLPGAKGVETEAAEDAAADPADGDQGR